MAPNLLWCGDLTEIVTEGKLYRASVLDLFSRNCLGLAFSPHRDADMAEAALVMAIANRGGDVEGVIFHSDRRSEVTAEAFEIACRLPPAGRHPVHGPCWVLFGQYRQRGVPFHHQGRVHLPAALSHREKARTKISNWILTCYNRRRRYSACNGMSPHDYEQFILETRGSTASS